MAADFLGFLAGKGEGVPCTTRDGKPNKDGLTYFTTYHSICRPFYKPRPYL